MIASKVIEHTNFFGLKLSMFEEWELLTYIKDCVNDHKKIICYGYSLGTLPYFKKHPEIAMFSNHFEVLVSDGRGLYILTRLFGFRLKSDISIPNMTWKILGIANKNKFSVLIIGSSPENNRLATQRARQLYPSATFFDGIDGGYFTAEDQIKSVEYINTKKPDILLIGVSSPKKEHFAYTWKEKLEVKVIVPFGGAIDILSGKSRPIPIFIKKMALGGLYRFMQEPRRLFRDSILYAGQVLLILIPYMLIRKITFTLKNFSIPRFYNKNYEYPIT